MPPLSPRAAVRPLSFALLLALTITFHYTNAQITNWTGAINSDWSTAGNWTNGVPTSTGTATINTITPNSALLGSGNSAQVQQLLLGDTVGTSGALTVNGDLTTSNVLSVGNSLGSNSSLAINGGFVFSAAVTMGASGTAAVAMTSGTWLTSSTVILGNAASGAASLNLQGGSMGSKDAIIGNSGIGAVTVAGGTWNISNSLTIGAEAGSTGSVLISSGGLFAGNVANIGNSAGSSIASLIVNAPFSFSALSVVINPNGTLQGIGSLGGNVTNSGLVIPGASIGTLTLLGSYTQTPAGTLLIQLGNGTASLLAVESAPGIGGGTASLDGTLQLQLLPEFNVASFDGRTVPILTTSNGITGDFSNIDAPPGLNFELVFNPTRTELGITFSLEALVEDLLAGDTLAGGNLATVFGFFFAFFEVEEEDFIQLFPIFNVNLKDLFFNVTNTQYNELVTRLAAIRSGVNLVTLQGLPEDPMAQQRTQREAKYCKQIMACPETPLRWDIFASASGVFSTMRNIGDLPRINAATGYFSAGADCRLNEYLNVGLYSGYQGMWTYRQKQRYDYGSHRPHNNSWLQSNGVKWGLYGTAHWEGFYLNAIVGGGAHFLNLNRSIDFLGMHRVARSHPFLGELDTLLGGGYEYRWNNWIFGINNSTQYTYLGISSATESGANGLNTRLNSQNYNSLVYTLGGNISYLWEIAPNYRILPTIGLAWQHEFLNYGKSVYGAFGRGAGVPFYLDTVDGARNNAIGVAGIAAQIGSRIGAFAYYIPQFGGGLIYSNAAVVGLTYNF
ncbi:MAG: hypothetical protein C5B47_08160 [Verrucomicrobia bacterium]|nr:MAG: hypothetical protein C5B47_08160 [Verrucomicrobiota bacterium]